MPIIASHPPHQVHLPSSSTDHRILHVPRCKPMIHLQSDSIDQGWFHVTQRELGFTHCLVQLVMDDSVYHSVNYDSLTFRFNWSWKIPSIARLGFTYCLIRLIKDDSMHHYVNYVSLIIWFNWPWMIPRITM